MRTLSKKKILFLITKSNWGGAQRYVYDLATSLPTDQYDVTVALGGDGELVEKLETAGIVVHRLKRLQRDISVRKEIFSFWEISHLIREIDPDVLHVNSSKAGFIGAFLGSILGVPRVIFTAHGWAFNEERMLPVRFIVGFLHWITIIFAHQTITVSHELQRQMRWPATKRKMVTIHNGRRMPSYIPREEARTLIAELDTESELSTEQFWTVTIAELHPIKQHHIMIEAVARLRDTDINVQHIIIGDGDLRKKLEQKVAKLDLGQNIFFAGPIHEAAQYLKAFDLFVLPSRSEALAYVVIEAAQAELPIIASNVGGIPEIITNEKNGTLFPSGDVSALVESIKYYIDNPDTARSHAHSASIRSQAFSIENMVSNTLDVYNSTNTV